MEFPVVTYHCTCVHCGRKFTVETSCGRADICPGCSVRLLEIIWGCTLRIHPLFKVVTPA
jgi:Zn finger protein HypA/HybF involved in hydrogenase expression